MTTNTARGTITWADFTAAGIDLERVQRTHDDLSGGWDAFVLFSTDGITRVTLGPAVDMSGDDGEADLGFDVAVAELVSYGQGDDQEWSDTAQNHFDTVAELLAWVAGLL